MPALSRLDDLTARRIWDGIVGRPLHGERLTLAVVELDPGAVLPEHAHDHEQLGLLVRGEMTFRIGGEERTLGPGGTWCIPSNTPHSARVGPEGATAVDVFAPARDDWRSLEAADVPAGAWPARG